MHIQLFLENFEKRRFKLVPTYGRDHLESKMNNILGKNPNISLVIYILEFFPILSY